MYMPMMNIGIVRMHMRLRGVNMRVCMRLLWVNTFFVSVLMMLIMRMPMRMFKLGVLMGMTMSFGEMQPYADAHEHGIQQRHADGAA